MPDIYDPRTRDEKFLNAIKSGDISELPDPATREELFLYAIAEKIAELSSVNNSETAETTETKSEE